MGDDRASADYVYAGPKLMPRDETLRGPYDLLCPSPECRDPQTPLVYEVSATARETLVTPRPCARCGRTYLPAQMDLGR